MYKFSFFLNKERLTVYFKLSTKSESSYAPGCFRFEGIHVTTTKRHEVGEKKHIVECRRKKNLLSQFFVKERSS